MLKIAHTSLYPCRPLVIANPRKFFLPLTNIINNGMNNGRAFTVIEILIVVAIIGLLGSIVLVALRGSREDAEVASGEQFSSNIHHGLGAYAVGIWNFDDGPFEEMGQYYFKEATGDGPDLLCYGSCGEVPGKIRSGAMLAGSSYLETNALLSSPETGEITQELWVNLEDESALGNLSIWIDVVHWFYSNQRIYVDMQTDSGWCYINFGTTLVIDRWIHLALTYNGTETKLFVNGKEKGKSVDCSGKLIQEDDSFITHIGYNFEGVFDEIRVYGMSLSSAQIWNSYVEGVKKKGLSINN